MAAEPIFCYPALDDDAYLAYLREIYAKSSNDAAFVREITPLQTAELAEQAVVTRLGILKRVYRGEYFTDSFDVPRLARQVRSSREFIWFWGQSEAIEEWLNGTCQSLETCKFGTVSVVDASHEFGVGMGEICRSGSTTSAPLKPYAVKRIIDFLSRANPSLYDAFHTLFLVPRVRAATEAIRGGRSVNMIHREYVRSRFWGFAPWYIMQGGFLECLEYREINRSLSDVLNGIDAFPTLYLEDEDDRLYVKALFTMNLPTICDAISFGKATAISALGSFRQIYEVSDAIRPYNHRTFEPARPNDTTVSLVTLDQIDATLHDAACTVVTLDVSHPHQWGVQQLLRERGYRLTSIRPPRLIGTNPQPCYGSWARPRPQLPVAPPFYSDCPPGNDQERTVLHRLRHLLDQWTPAV